MTEASREELLGQADDLYEQAQLHRDHGREGRANELEAQAERIRAQAEGAPVGPSPDSIAELRDALHAKLREGGELIQRGAEVVGEIANYLDDVLSKGGVTTEVVGVEIDREYEIAALRARITELESDLELARTPATAGETPVPPQPQPNTAPGHVPGDTDDLATEPGEIGEPTPAIVGEADDVVAGPEAEAAVVPDDAGAPDPNAPLATGPGADGDEHGGQSDDDAREGGEDQVEGIATPPTVGDADASDAKLEGDVE